MGKRKTREPVVKKRKVAPRESNGKLEWKPFLRSYDPSEVCVLTFQSTEDAYVALDILWKGRLRGMPFGIPGYDSLVVPKQAIPYFTEAGLKFEEGQLLTHDELTAEELNDLRKQSIY